jgi:hypothetical protein
MVANLILIIITYYYAMLKNEIIFWTYMHSTDNNVCIPNHRFQIGNDNNVAETEHEHEQINNWQESQINECWVFPHVALAKYIEAQQIAKEAH